MIVNFWKIYTVLVEVLYCDFESFFLLLLECV